jgi:hypothetical protein
MSKYSSECGHPGHSGACNSNSPPSTVSHSIFSTSPLPSYYIRVVLSLCRSIDPSCPSLPSFSSTSPLPSAPISPFQVPLLPNFIPPLPLPFPCLSRPLPPFPTFPSRQVMPAVNALLEEQARVGRGGGYKGGGIRGHGGEEQKGGCEGWAEGS